MPRIDHPIVQAMLKRAEQEAIAHPPPTAEELFAAEAEARPEAAARKQRSLATLAREGVPVNIHLPTIESEAEVRRRADEEVALRAIALAIVAAQAQSRDHERTRQLIETYRLADGFTPKERAFIDSPQPAPRDCTQLTWRIECVWVLLWSLGFVEALGRPDRQVDPGEIFEFIDGHGRDGLVTAARLRPMGELLDAADLLYRYHWPIRDAQFRGTAPPPQLNPDVVAEWHYALNWLIGYGDREWDEVTTDT